MRRLISLLLLALTLPVQAETTAATLFSALPQPTDGPASAIGTYAKGCAAGLVELPESGPTWQAMRLSRHRNFGHPVTVQFVQDLSAFAATQKGWAGLYIGDIGNPRGGPMNSGHASHQMGLDVDIWQLPPQRLDLSRAEREEISSIPVRSADQLSVTGNWTPQHRAIMRAAALDPRVDRIFVAAAVKIEMCKTATPDDTAWLQKIRPEGGHDTHFHVRLKCPEGSRHCQTQKPSVSELSKGGNGCDENLMYWVSNAYLHPKPVKPDPTKPRKKGARELLVSDLPRQCRAVLNGG
jgi:penicillin-insensitive murein DD-endopeptidase